MHQPVRDNLEEHLRGIEKEYRKPVPGEMQEHLAACEDCMAELKTVESHAAAIRSLRAGAVEPRAGFYARVMNRIDETRAKASIWSAFLEPVFARRIIYASLALVLLLGTYLVSSDSVDQSLPQSQPTMAITQQDQKTVDADFENGTVAQQQRDAVLVNLASYQE
ncbi:MAG TPA: hypothetical protein VKU01_14490 [Bryobacteraceae bacterium]|nr:hypothetical protein [Bryobacteraceae bacterium]